MQKDLHPMIHYLKEQDSDACQLLNWAIHNRKRANTEFRQLPRLGLRNEHFGIGVTTSSLSQKQRADSEVVCRGPATRPRQLRKVGEWPKGSSNVVCMSLAIANSYNRDILIGCTSV
jgi:hypothetical protein